MKKLTAGSYFSKRTMNSTLAVTVGTYPLTPAAMQTPQNHVITVIND
jgi:hypothetical protein